jgi:hypothetical protein
MTEWETLIFFNPWYVAYAMGAEARSLVPAQCALKARLDGYARKPTNFALPIKDNKVSRKGAWLYSAKLLSVSEIDCLSEAG